MHNDKNYPNYCWLKLICHIFATPFVATVFFYFYLFSFRVAASNNLLNTHSIKNCLVNCQKTGSFYQMYELRPDEMKFSLYFILRIKIQINEIVRESHRKWKSNILFSFFLVHLAFVWVQYMRQFQNLWCRFIEFIGADFLWFSFKSIELLEKPFFFLLFL